MLQKKIKRILNKIKFSQEQSDELRDKFGWRYVQTQNPKTNNKYKKLRVYTFTTPKKNIKDEPAGYKYIVHIEEYEYDYFLISFFPKLNTDFYVRQQRLVDRGQKFHDKYSYQTKENIPF